MAELLELFLPFILIFMPPTKAAWLREHKNEENIISAS